MDDQNKNQNQNSSSFADDNYSDDFNDDIYEEEDTLDEVLNNTLKEDPREDYEVDDNDPFGDDDEEEEAEEEANEEMILNKQGYTDDYKIDDEDLSDEEEAEYQEALDDNEGYEETEDYDEEELDDEEEVDDEVTISKSKIVLAKKLLTNIQENNEKLISLLGGLVSDDDEARINISQITDGIIDEEEEGGKVIEGVFDGEGMIGPDGKQYSMPANYASKSKLVEGDLLKLTITPKGTFLYKQTKPVERKRVVGTLEKTEEGSFLVKAEDKKWKTLTASITYYKGDAGDEVVILVPKNSDSSWGAVENIIKK